MCGAAICTVPKVDLNRLERIEMWCCRRIAVISWTDRLKNEEVLKRIAENKNILHTIKKPNSTRQQFTTLNQQNVQFFFRYLRYNSTLNIGISFDPQGTIVKERIQNNMA